VPSNLAARDIATLVHPYTNLDAFPASGPLIIERGKGVWAYDTGGKAYLEGMAGLWCTALGHGNAELAEAARAQMEKLPFAHLFGGKSHDPAIELADRLQEMLPVPSSKIFFCNSGSEANDTQIKLVRYMNNARGLPKKKKFISRQRAYHGVTIAAASLTALPVNQTDFDVPIPGILYAACPHHYRHAQPGESEAAFATRLAADLDALIEQEGPETVAAFIAEPVMGAGGVIVPPEGYFEKIAAVCRKHDVYMIADEVICGFGRLGTPFGSQALGFAPDSVSVAKALSSGNIPIAALSVPPVMDEALAAASRKIGMFGHGFTYTGHPVAAAVALKTLDIYARDGIFAQVAAKAPAFQARLQALGTHDLVGHARGLGLIGAVELVRDKKTKEAFNPQRGVAARCVGFAQEEGLIVRALMGDTVSLCPPLIISDEEIGELFARLTRALDRTRDWAHGEGLI
jgi:4-aminobutyrate--pyruvate transaminase